MVMEGWTGRLRAGACWALAGLCVTAAALLAAASVASADPLAWAPPPGRLAAAVRDGREPR